MKILKNTIDRKCVRLCIASMFLCLISCEDFISVDPPKTEIISQTVFSSDVSATSAIRGIYSLMSGNQSFTNGGLEEFTGIASDELINYSVRADQVQFFQNSLTARNGDVYGIFWREAYKYINNANAILEGLEISSGMTLSGKRQIEGEAKFVRAFCYFYLVNLFDDVPYLTSADYRINSVASRTPKDEVYEFMEADLLDAINLLATDYSFSNGERTQPNQGAAIALLARLYRFQEKWEAAETQASLLIDNDLYSLESNLNSVFLANSSETIWQLKPVIPGFNSPYGQLFILTAAPNGNSRRVSMTPGLKNAFEPTDQRGIKWVSTFTNASGTWNFSHKYKVGLNAVVSEYSTVFRLAEQYLIRAEARTQLDDFDGAKEDINVIRNRAELGDTPATDASTLLVAIEQERRAELFTEWGHRWLDLKRTGQSTVRLAPIKSDWQTTDEFFPIPESERLLNTNLSQNPGY